MRYLLSLKSRLHARRKCGVGGVVGTTYTWPFGGHFEMFCGRPKGHSGVHGSYGVGAWK